MTHTRGMKVKSRSTSSESIYKDLTEEMIESENNEAKSLHEAKYDEDGLNFARRVTVEGVTTWASPSHPDEPMVDFIVPTRGSYDGIISQISGTVSGNGSTATHTTGPDRVRSAWVSFTEELEGKVNTAEAVPEPKIKQVEPMKNRMDYFVFQVIDLMPDSMCKKYFSLSQEIGGRNQLISVDRINDFIDISCDWRSMNDLVGAFHINYFCERPDMNTDITLESIRMLCDEFDEMVGSQIGEETFEKRYSKMIKEND